MTAKKPDTVPRRYQRNLVPDCAVGVPDAIRDESERLRTAGLAEEAAISRRRDTEQKAKAAPKADAQADIEAVRAGQDPPPPTAPKLEREAETARQAERASRSIAKTAERALERAYRAHAADWLPAERDAPANQVEEVLRLVDEVEAALVGLGDHAGLRPVPGT